MDLLREVSSNAIYTAAGEPDTGFTKKGKKRRLGVDKTKPEPWFEKGRYTQLDFPKADDAYKGDEDKNIQRVQVIKKVVNTGLKYEDFYDAIASWDKYGGQDYSTDFGSE